jgi:hypothetical protein
VLQGLEHGGVRGKLVDPHLKRRNPLPLLGVINEGRERKHGTDEANGEATPDSSPEWDNRKAEWLKHLSGVLH